MPSSSVTRDDGTSRRRVLAVLGTAVAGSLAGCSGRLPGAGPARVDAETAVERDRDPRLRWQYPPRDGDADGIGYAAVEADRVPRRGASTPALELVFSSTVGGIASGEPYEGYTPDWFRFRVRPPTTYEGSLQYHLRVEPPGQWEQFSAYYDVRGTVRRATVELRDVETRGTVLVPAVFDPGANPLPSRLHCSFTVRASRPGVLGRSVRVSDRGTLPLTAE